MCRDEPFGINRLGRESSAETITAHSLTKHYKTLLANSRVEVFYCGAHDETRVESAVLSALASLPRSERSEDVSTDVRIHAVSEKTRVFTDHMDVNQGKLSVGFRLGKTMLSPNYAALLVFNAVFGGAVTSKLFLNVREKLSLSYYASSLIEKHKGVMAVASGVEFAKFGEALDEILSQLEAVKKGDISDWELVSAKRAVITALKSTMDRPPGLEELFFDQAVASVKLTPDETAALADGVTREEIMEIASGVELDTVYYLAGADGRGESDEN
jgi:predicted Zn-dependent peptidase